MCGCTLILSLAASQARLMSFWKLDTVIGEPRSDTNRNGDLSSASRCRRRSARSSRPVRGCVAGVPFLARVTARLHDTRERSAKMADLVYGIALILWRAGIVQSRLAPARRAQR